MRSGRQGRGFTYLAALLLAAASAAAVGGAAQVWSQARQREKEAELLWIGEQFRQAIGLYYQRSPGSVKRYPAKLEELLEDPRHLGTMRYLRRIYTDPITGHAEWGVVTAPGGGIMGVHSLSGAQPLRQVSGATYSQWQFVYEPPLAPTEAVRN